MSTVPRILVVDDEDTIRLAIEMMLEERDWIVKGAADGTEALQALADASFDVVILDKNLPDISGVEVLKKIRETNSELRAIMLTGYANVESAVEMATLGVDAFLEKPLRDIYELGDVVATSLSKKKAAAAEASRLRKPAEDGQGIVVGGQALSFLVDSVLLSKGGIDVVQIESWLQEMNLNPKCFTELATPASEALEAADLVFLACAEGILSLTKEVREAHPKAKIVVFQPEPTLNTTMALIALNLTGIITEDLGNASSRTRVGRILDRIVKDL